MAGQQFTRNYPAGVSSLDALKLMCQTDEGLSANIVSLQLGTVDGADVTIGVFEVASSSRVGRLALAEYKSEAEEQSLRATHISRGEAFLFKGEAYIQNGPMKLLAFGHGPGDRP